MTQNYEKCNWKAEYSEPDCMWQIISPLGVTITRCYNKRQTMDILLEIARELTNGEAEEIDEEEEGFLF
tara:strand:- start:1729 stop:1935 length:207 start_codon:yes stop_codon:yes gene_type:complete